MDIDSPAIPEEGGGACGVGMMRNIEIAIFDIDRYR